MRCERLPSTKIYLTNSIPSATKSDQRSRNSLLRSRYKVASGDNSGPSSVVRGLYLEARKLRADYLRQLRLLQKQAGVSEAQLRAIERERYKISIPNEADWLWRAEIETAPSTADMDVFARRAMVRLVPSIDFDWLLKEARKPYRLESSFLRNPLHLVNGVRVQSDGEPQGPQRFARMLLLAEDHLDKRLDIDFFSAATLVPELAVLGDRLDEIKSLGPEAERKLAALPSMTDEMVSSTVYELLVGAASVRCGLDLTMIPENRSMKVPEYRINNLHQVPAVIECKRRRGLTDYELAEAAYIERLYGSIRTHLRDLGVYGSLQASFAVPVDSVASAEFSKLVMEVVAKPDQEKPTCTKWGSLSFRSLPYRRSIAETRLYSPEYLQEVFGWGVLQDEWDGLLCEVETPSRLGVELFTMPLCLKWRSESAEALMKKARGIKSLWADAIKQIPDGEIGFIYVAYPEGSRAPIADARTRQILKELGEVWHRWSVRAPVTIVSRLYGRALGVGYPDLIENVLLAATDGEEHWLTDLPQRIFT